MDTIDATNLNRQFLFRAPDVGKSKAEAAAAFVNKRVAGVQVHPFLGKMQDKPEEYYQKFHVVICGLDSVPARRWINSTLVGLLTEDEDGNVDMDTIIPMIDAGTEGFKGHTRVICPGITSCLEVSRETCTLLVSQTFLPSAQLSCFRRLKRCRCAQWLRRRAMRRTAFSTRG
jgi:ubiquitin-activating enzyme E1 C